MNTLRTSFLLLSLADDLDVVGCMPGIRLPVEVYARVRVSRTGSPSQGAYGPSRTFCEPAHLSAFLFATFSNAYENDI